MSILYETVHFQREICIDFSVGAWFQCPYFRVERFPLYQGHIDSQREKRSCIPHRSTVYGKIQTWKRDVLYLAIRGLRKGAGGTVYW